jgi:predicted O-linked N-acetylglucosamine transferase (SPINDLY family)
MRSSAASYKVAAESGAQGMWYRAAVLLAAINEVDEAYVCFKKAIDEEPNNPELMDGLIVMLCNNSKSLQGVEYARRQLANPKSTNGHRVNAVLTLSLSLCHDEANLAIKSFVDEALLETEPALVGLMLGALHFTCEWNLVDAARAQATKFYATGEFNAVSEFPLTNVIWCKNERINIAVSQAYAQRTIPQVEPFLSQSTVDRERLRIGYISSDFREHATMHLITGLFENHNKEKFEIFAYDYSIVDNSDYRRRFLRSIDHHTDISLLTDLEAAKKIESDHLDILIDLKGHTGASRPRVLAYRPAPIQVAYLGFPGSTGLSCIDYIIGDRYVTPDSSKDNYSERLCRLPHSYQCNGKAAEIVRSEKKRSDFGLPDDKIVFCSFHQQYKIDSATFSVWLEILRRVQNSVLWLLIDKSVIAKKNIIEFTEKQGVDPKRLIFTSTAMPAEHRERLQFADIALDTFLCNGHTTTSDMLLWGGLPVVTCKGQHFSSRVSESLLSAMNLPELVGADQEDAIRIACELGTNDEYRKAIREKIVLNRQISTLFDPARFAVDFERGLTMIIANHRSECPLGILDIPAT